MNRADKTLHRCCADIANHFTVCGQTRAFDAQVRDHLTRLDGTSGSGVALLAGVSVADLPRFGGMPEAVKA